MIDTLDTDEALADFAARAPIGTTVVFYPTKPFVEGEGVRSHIRSLPWALGHGAIVVRIAGRTSCVAIDHLVIVGGAR